VERVERALADLAAGRPTAEAPWLAVARSRLAQAGLELPPARHLPEELEIAFYQALGERGEEDPYGAYLSWRRELESFLSALELRREP
jgi:hypothetical protein